MKIKKTLQGDQEIHILVNEQGIECTCPYKPAIPIQTQFGQNSLIELPCTSKCALFYADNMNFYCNSGKNNQNISISEIIDQTKTIKLTDL